MVTRSLSRYRLHAALALTLFCLVASGVAMGPPSTPAKPERPTGTRIRGPAVFGPTTCPVFAGTGWFYDIRTLKPTGISFDANHGRGPAALSADGNWYAAANEIRELARNAVTVFDVATGKRVADAPGVESRKPVHFLAFAGSKWLVLASLAGAGGRGSVDVRDVPTGRLVRNFTISGSDSRRICVSADGRFLGQIAEDRLEVYNIGNGQPLGAMRTPALKRKSADANRGALPSPARGPRPSMDATMDRIETSQFFRTAQDLQFSPDGNEIACLFGRTDARAICWDMRGNITVDESFSTNFLDTESLQWVPDGAGLLIDGRYLVDRQTRRVVWIASWSPSSRTQLHFMDANSLIYALGDSLSVVQIPWADIRKSVAAMARKAPAALRPGQSVAVRVEFGQILGDQEQTRKDLVEAISKRLVEAGVGVDGNQSLAYVVRFSEKQGEAVKIVETAGPLSPQRDTGRTAHLASGQIVIELFHRDSNTCLWRRNLSEGSSRDFEGEVNDQVVRQSMVKKLVAKMREVHLPYFIPAEPGLVALPVRQNEERE